MQAEAALGRIGLWFLIMLAAIAGAVAAADSGFAAHATIVAVIAFAMIWISASRFDPLGKAQGFFRMPEGPSRYDDEPIRWGVIATVFWAVVGMLVGLIIALQLAYPLLNMEPWLNFGRLRPLHTSGVIFAFGGNILIASSYYMVPSSYGF